MVALNTGILKRESMNSADFEALRQARANLPVQRTMMQVPLRVTDIIRRAEKLFGNQIVVSRHGPNRLIHQSYREIGEEARRLASVLHDNGIKPGMRVATLMWNHAAHLAAYYAVPGIEAVLHPLNPRLLAEELAYIVADAGDAAILIDDDLVPLWREVERFVHLPLVIVHALGKQVNDGQKAGGYLKWHEALAQATPMASWPEGTVDENTPVAICYTSGTTGRPKGVVYSHRSVLLHSLALATPDALNVSGRDTILTLTPMFHVNAWSMPYTALMLGAKQVLPGPRPSSMEIAELMAQEGVTAALGVPTIWTDVLGILEQHPGRWSFKPDIRIYSGGTAPPAEMYRRFDRQGMYLQTGWGMTETSPMGSQTWLKPETDLLEPERRLAVRTSNGIALPLVEMRNVDQDGNVLPWDGESLGELQVRGPWVTEAYIGHPDPISAITHDGWLKTGDIVVFESNGYMRLVDRLKDLVKSGGEWISSVAMENALCDCPTVAEACVIAVPDVQWGERPLAIVVLKPGLRSSAQEIRDHLAAKFPKWMVPERIEFSDIIPRTSVGKLDKVKLRKQFA